MDRTDPGQAAVKLSATADRRMELAADRTVLAAKRAYAAWARTGLAALASGVQAKLARGRGEAREWLRGEARKKRRGEEGPRRCGPELLIDLMGTVLILFSAFPFGAGVWRERKPGTPPPRPGTRRVSPLALPAVNGFLARVALSALFGIWLGHTGS